MVAVGGAGDQPSQGGDIGENHGYGRVIVGAADLEHIGHGGSGGDEFLEIADDMTAGPGDTAGLADDHFVGGGRDVPVGENEHPVHGQIGRVEQGALGIIELEPAVNAAAGQGMLDRAAGQEDFSCPGVGCLIIGVALDCGREAGVVQGSAGKTEGAVDRDVPGEGLGSAAADAEVVIGKHRDGLRSAIKIDGAVGDGVGAGSRGETAGDANDTVGTEDSSTGGTADQVEIIESGDGLNRAAVIVDSAVGNGVGVGARHKGSRDADGGAGRKEAGAGRTAEEVAVIYRGDRL